MKKLLMMLGGAGVLLVAAAGPAAAHIEPSVEEAAAGSELVFALTVPHGCEDDSDTVKLEVQLPDGIDEAVPEAVPGWDASVDGNVVTWEGGPLLHDQYLQFGLSVALPDTPGETLLFPTIQTCQGGAHTDWIEEGTPGEAEPEHPAPAITLTEATADEEGHSHDHATDEGSTDEGSTDEADHHDEAASADDGGDDDDGPDALAIVALIVGALGLAAGGYALASTRKASRA